MLLQMKQAPNLLNGTNVHYIIIRIYCSSEWGKVCSIRNKNGKIKNINWEPRQVKWNILLQDTWECAIHV